MEAIQYVKSVPRWLATRLLARRWPGVCTGPLGCLRRVELPEPSLPGPRWVKIAPRLSGICGSDLALLRAKGTLYFSPMTSTPFVPGHEIVGTIVETGPEARGWSPGRRVAVVPALCCAVRERPPCAACAGGRFGACEAVTAGPLARGVQTGYCRETGGGWSTRLVAHVAQLYPLPDDLPDEAAVLLEPLACAVHAVLKAPPEPGETALVLGCGTLGLLVVAALRRLCPGVRIVAAARYPHQERLARDLGADLVWGRRADFLAETARLVGGEPLRPELGPPVLLRGAERVFDCVGSSGTLDLSLRLARSGGAVVLVGMPGRLAGLEGTALWHKEIRLLGAYTYGVETYGGERISSFALAERLLAAEPERFAVLVGARFPLARYRAAIDAALHTGRSGAAKVVFAFDPVEIDRPQARSPAARRDQGPPAPPRERPPFP